MSEPDIDAVKSAMGELDGGAELHLETHGGKVCGHVISPAFEGAGNKERQKSIWDILDRHNLGEKVGVLFGWTRLEWEG